MTQIIVVFLIAFVAEYIDSTFGMGYGTILTPILLILGFPVLQVVPAILASEFCTGLFAGVLHIKNGNISYIDNKNKKILLLISVLSILGVTASVFIAVSIPKILLKSYIAVLVAGIGIYMIITRNSKMKFSWKKLTGISVLAAFNKGISGGGYGPLVTGGQIISGTTTKEAVSITSLSESITCFFAVIFYYVANKSIDFTILLPLLLGGMLSVPLSVFTVKRFNDKHIRFIIGIMCAVLGIIALGSVLL